MSIILPLFTISFIINNIFLALDFLFFPLFVRRKIKKPVFILSLPRSGSTLIHHKLASQKKFTSLQLWEIVFAPSIIQKFLFLGLGRIDRLLGSPIVRMINLLGRKSMPEVANSHKTGILAYEEDDLLTIWSLNSPYLQFSYGSGELFVKYVFFDTKLDTFSQKRTLNIYKRMLQRHHFVFNRGGEKIHLAKSPYFLGKAASLKMKFPDARVIYINRPPEKSIASSLHLMNNLSAVFSNELMNEDLRRFNIEAMVEMLNHFEEKKSTYRKEDIISVYFSALIKGDEAELKRLADFLELDLHQLINSFAINRDDHISSSTYESLSEEEIQYIHTELPESYWKQPHSN